VIQPDGDLLDPASMTEAWTGPGRLVNSGDFDGLENEAAKEKIADHLVEKKIGQKAVNFRLRDWGVSRQRYWGTPIPVIYCDSCGVVPVPEADLPVVLPQDVVFTGEGGSPLANLETFNRVDCPKCGQPARRETDTFDTFVESSWYFARYTSPHCDTAPLERKAADHWMPVDQYIGGIEHAVMHLLYARFFTKVMRDLGYLSSAEPFHRLLCQGMVCMETYSCKEHGWLYPEEVADGKCSRCGQPAISGRIEKMSKSKKNVIDPDAIISRFGADTARLFTLFASPPEKDLEWKDQGVEGCSRFLNRIWRLVAEHQELIATAGPVEQAEGAARDLRRQVHRTIKKVTEDIDGRFHFNTAIAAVMELINGVTGYKQRSESPEVLREALETIVRLLNPFVPHMTAELWEQMGHTETLESLGWPEWDEEALAEEQILIVVQVNGKVRGRVTVPVDASKEAVQQTAMADENVMRACDGKTVRKEIYVPGRLFNIVVS